MSGDEHKGEMRDPKVEDWAAINSLGGTGDAKIPSYQKRATQDSFVVPTEVKSIDFEPESFKSRRGLVLVGIILGFAGLLFLVMGGEGDSFDGTAAGGNSDKMQATEQSQRPEPIPAFREIEFASDPSEAIVVLNGNVLDKSTPIKKMVSTAGLSQARFVSDGYRAITAELKIKDEVVYRKLSPLNEKNGRIHVESKPSDAEVSVDGTFLGNTPLDGDEGDGEWVTSGDWSVIEVTKEGFSGVVYLRRIPENGSVRFTPKLTRQTEEPSDSQVKVMTSPADVQVFIRVDGKDEDFVNTTGRSGLRLEPRPMGTRIEISARKKGYFPQTMVIDLQKPLYEVQFSLKPTERRRGGVHIVGPKGISGYLDGPKYRIEGFPYQVEGLIAGQTYTLKLQQAKPKKRFQLPIQVDADVVTEYELKRVDGVLTIHRKETAD